jgi:hypothetical protein
LAALCDSRRAPYFRSRAPWVTALVFILAMLPHAVWLVEENFPPLRWIGARRTAQSAFDFLRSLGEYSFGTLGYVSMALILVVLFVRPSGRAVRDSWLAMEAARRPATILFWTPLLLPIAVAIGKSTNLLSVWNEPSFGLLPVMMLASPLVAVSRTALMRIAACVTAFTLIAIAASPLVALILLKRGVENDAAYAQLAGAAAQRQWRESISTPLRLVAGPFALANSAAFYMPDRPSTFSDFSDYLSPWVTPARIAREGVAIICPADEAHCLDGMNALIGADPAARRGAVTLIRHWLGFSSQPKRFIVATVPPRDDAH